MILMKPILPNNCQIMRELFARFLKPLTVHEWQFSNLNSLDSLVSITRDPQKKNVGHITIISSGVNGVMATTSWQGPTISSREFRG